MRKHLVPLAASVLALASAAHAQTTTTRTGDDNASITGGSTSSPARAQTQPRPTPSPVTAVRPLSEEDIRRQREASARRAQSAATGDPDVLLDVPNLSVEEITLKVKDLRARLSGRASRQPPATDGRRGGRHRRSRSDD